MESSDNAMNIARSGLEYVHKNFEFNKGTAESPDIISFEQVTESCLEQCLE